LQETSISHAETAQMVANEVHHNPFLMLDQLGTGRPEEYISGFPSHPHRGFETVTLMLAALPVHELVVQREPFVMNTLEGVKQTVPTTTADV
jgi:redox-sensitive bicupin YhaK (pirin superfamily)